jgi:hypothetical protein
VTVSLPDPQAAASKMVVCPLCGAPALPADERCRECSMTLAGVGDRPDVFTRRSLWLWAAGLLAIYLVVMVIVLLAS